MKYKIFDQILDQQDIDTLLAYNNVNDNTTDVRPDVRSKHPIWDKDDFPQDILQSALDKILPEPYEVETVLFYKSQVSFRLHVDSGLFQGDPIYCNVLLPLHFLGPATSVLFDNHYFGISTRFARSNVSPYRYNLPDRAGSFIWVDDIRVLLDKCQNSPNSIKEFEVNDQFIQNLQQLVCKRQNADSRTSDYSQITNFLADKKIDQTLYKKYLSHMPAEDLDGLTVETVYDWKKGGALTFPRTQLHCAGAGHKEKIGVSIFTKKRQ